MPVIIFARYMDRVILPTVIKDSDGICYEVEPVLYFGVPHEVDRFIEEIRQRALISNSMHRKVAPPRPSVLALATGLDDKEVLPNVDVMHLDGVDGAQVFDFYFVDKCGEFVDLCSGGFDDIEGMIRKVYITGLGSC